jgi:hypothetical protein
MTVQRKQINYAGFFELCEWVKRQPSPITLTRVDLAKAYHADTGITVSTSAIKHALDATKVDVISQRGIAGKANGNRTARLASVLKRLVARLETDLGGSLMSEDDRNFLFRTANGSDPKPKKTE